MVVHGQPKTTSAYIQATGRVGRMRGGLVVTLYRSSRPRDLSHYEFFCGYHRMLDKSVEEITAAPFSVGTLERALGPVIVSMLRNVNYRTHGLTLKDPIYLNEYAHLIKLLDDSGKRGKCLRSIRDLIVNYITWRAKEQPDPRRPNIVWLERFIHSLIDRWKSLAKKHNDNLRYNEYFTTNFHVVLGDLKHKHAEKDIVFQNAPQSLRDIEGTIAFDLYPWRKKRR